MESVCHDLVLNKGLEDNLQLIKEILNNCSDVVYREFVLAQNYQNRLALIYIDGLAGESQVRDGIIRALALEAPMAISGQTVSKTEALEFIKQRGLCVQQYRETEKLQDVIQAILSGETVLLVDGHASAIINGSRTGEGRAISESKTEPSARGPKESFVETLQVNTVLIRRKIKSPQLKIEFKKMGTISKTDVALIYLEGIVDEKLVAEVKKRLERINIDAILESGYIEELIEDNPWSPFPTVNHTERPDRVAAMLLEGRAAILVDGTPFALTVPNLFVEYLQAPDDYYERYLFSSAVRLIRLLAIITSLILPSLYVAVTSFHQELLPNPLLLSIAAIREVLPLPIFLEVFIAEVAYEVLREAGKHLPRSSGQMISTLGALLLGGIGIWAGLFAATTPLVVIFAGIASFAVADSPSFALRLARFGLLILSGVLGLLGLLSGVMVIAIHMCTLRSFGVPYLSPLTPTTGVVLDDVFFRAPWRAAIARPRLIVHGNRNRKNFKDRR